MFDVLIQPVPARESAFFVSWSQRLIVWDRVPLEACLSVSFGSLQEGIYAVKRRRLCQAAHLDSMLGSIVWPGFGSGSPAETVVVNDENPDATDSSVCR